MGKFTLLKVSKTSPKRPTTQKPKKEHDNDNADDTKPSVVLAGEHRTMRNMMSLGTGSLSSDMSSVQAFEPTIAIKIMKRIDSDRTFSTSELSSGSSTASSSSSDESKVATGFVREQSTFLRVSDLDIVSSAKNSYNNDDDDDECCYPNFHHAASDTPKGIKYDPNEMWIALNDGTTIGSTQYSPIAPYVVEKLADFGLMSCLNANMWTPDGKTEKLLKGHHCQQWMSETFEKPSGRSVDVSTNNDQSLDLKEVLIWTGSFKHGKYGSELPAIRAAGLVNMSAKSLMELMVDSTRVKEYNKFSLGRTDLITFQRDSSSTGKCVITTKVMKSEAKPPMVRKTIEFVSILRAQELPDGNGYLIVSRAVEKPEEEEQSNKNSASTNKSEILLGVNVIRTVKGYEDSHCLMINVNHIRSPMIPMMLAKRIGLSSAVSFLNDIRGAASAATAC